ncbi:MAG: stage II sporulation protein R [Eubacteriales bacterium]|nr:stage II sporulation protein R [Eubacteriales bacterium]
MKKEMLWKKDACLGLFLLLFGLLLSMSRLQESREALAGRLAPSILRFHILANSDSQADQQVKLEVRSLILDYVAANTKETDGKEETAVFFNGHRAQVESLAGAYLAKRGFSYGARLSLAPSYFPTRVYGDFVFPCGTYDAVRIILGNGDGRNWWCVLYPRFCFVDAACGEIPASSRRVLENSINQDDFLLLENHRPDIDFAFRLFPFYSTAAKPATPQS